MPEYLLQDFAGGRDIRPGVFSAKDKNRFAELINFRVDKGRKLTRRFPLAQASGAFTAAVPTGIVELDGTRYVFANRVGYSAPVGLPDVKILLFDPPPGISDLTFEVLDALVFNGVVLALMRHGLTNVNSTWTARVMLHVFDEPGYLSTSTVGVSQPSYVSDPAFPTNFKAALSQVPYGDTGAVFQNEWDAAWRPSLTIVEDKVWIAGADGTPYGSGIGNARVWNEKQAADFKTSGDVWQAIIPYDGTAGLHEESVTFPVKFTDLIAEPRYCAYVLEYLYLDKQGSGPTNGHWYKFAEVTTGRALTLRSRFRIESAQAPWNTAAYNHVVQSLTGDGVATVFDFTGIPFATYMLNANLGQENARQLTVDGVTLRNVQFTITNNAGNVRVTFAAAPAAGAIVRAAVYPIDSTRYLATPQDSREDLDFTCPSATAVTFTRPTFPVPMDAKATGSGIVIRLRALTRMDHLTVSSGGGWTDVSTSVVGTTLLFEGHTMGQSNESGLAVPSVVADAFDEYRAFLGDGPTWGNRIVVGHGANGASDLYNVSARHVQAMNKYTNQGYQSGDSRPALMVWPDVSGFDRYHTKWSQGWRLHNGGAATFSAYSPLSTTPPTLFDAFNGYDFDHSTGTFYTARTGAQATLAGFGQAGNLDTLAHESNGQQRIRGLGAIRGRLAVFYEQSMQLWQINADITLDALIDRIEVGLGQRTSNPLVPFYNELIGLSQRGIRGFALSGLNNNNAVDNNIGEPIEDFGDYTCLAAGFWPYTGQYVAILQPTAGGALEIHAFDHSREAKIESWSKWTVVSLPTPVHPRLIADGSRLYFRSATGLYYFDGAATVYKDVTDGGTAYQSYARWHFSDFGRPGQAKRFRRFDMTFTGAVQVDFEVLTRGVRQAQSGFPLTTTTYGGEGVGLSMAGDALSIILTSTDQTGCRVEGIAVEFDYKHRQP